MSLVRLLTILLLFWMAWLMIRSWLNKGRPREKSRQLEAGKIVKCRHCEVHLPETEALRRDSQWFCSREHMQAFLANDGAQD